MKPFLVGVTGNIGAGKTTALKGIKSLGYTVISADILAKKVIYTESNKQILTKILGFKIIKDDGTYDLKEVRDAIFSNPHRKKRFEDFSKPLVWERIEKIINILEKEGREIIFIENAMLYEQGWQDKFDVIICIFCNEEESIKRILLSRNISERELLKIIDSQCTGAEKGAVSDLSIDTTYLGKDECHNEVITNFVKNKFAEKLLNTTAQPAT
jgi:dephospho-CoA kinase